MKNPIKPLILPGVFFIFYNQAGYAAEAASPPSPWPVTRTEPIPKAQSCVNYFEKGAWVYRYNEWTLSLTPTDCGRQTDSDNTPYAVDELIRLYSSSRYWSNTHGMRHQLICHFAIADSKPEWNLDPFRPDVGYSATVAAGCNPIDPLPETAP